MQKFQVASEYSNQNFKILKLKKQVSFWSSSGQMMSQRMFVNDMRKACLNTIADVLNGRHDRSERFVWLVLTRDEIESVLEQGLQ